MSTIIKPTDLNLNKIQYSKPEFNSIPGQKLGFKRIRLNYIHNNDLKDFIIESPANLLSWGLVENRDLQTNALNGYQMAINLWSKPNKTEEEEMFVESINKICDHAVEHLVKNRESIERYDLEKADLKKFNPLYWKMEKGKRVPDRGPTLYAKTKYSKKDCNIQTLFYDETKNHAHNNQPLSILNKHCYVKFTLKIESIYIGTCISLQLKLDEVGYRLKDGVELRSKLFPNIQLCQNVAPTETVVLDTKSLTEDLTSLKVEVDEDEESFYEEEEIEEIEIKEEVIEPKVEMTEKVVMDVTKPKRATKSKKITA